MICAPQMLQRHQANAAAVMRSAPAIAASSAAPAARACLPPAHSPGSGEMV